MKQQSLAFVLVTYDRLPLLRQVLDAIIAHSWSWDCFVIVDNCSTDGTAAYLRELNRNHRFQLISTERNLGHGAALARAFAFLQEQSGAEWYITLEDDSIPDNRMPDILLHAAMQSAFDFIAPAGYYVRTGKRVFVVNESDTPVEAQFGIFDGSILKASMLKQTGLPEQNWFMMFDDYEFCYRMLQKGFRIGVIRNDFHTILHHGGGERFSKASIWRGYYHARNHTLFLKKYFSLPVFADYVLIQGKTLVGLLAAPDRWRRIGLRVKGMVHGWMGKEGFTLDPGSLRFVK